MAVSIDDDDLDEDSETFIGTLSRISSTPNNVLIGSPSTAVGVIIDDDMSSKCADLSFVDVDTCKYIQYNAYIQCKIHTSLHTYVRIQGFHHLL